MDVRERVAVSVLVWLGVYPAVLVMNYALNAVGLGDLALPLKVAMTTIVTVPIIEFLVVPPVKRVLEHAERRLGIDGEIRGDD